MYLCIKIDGTMINTGYTHLDQLTGGFHNGELISIIGRPLMCRTFCT